MDKAPCVAILGPANSGKTTLLHLLDAALQAHPDEPLAYVVKGNPDGTGRYLYYVPEERDNLKPLVKGRWSPQTPKTIIGWIENARTYLGIALLDFGGKHDPGNQAMLKHCSHYLVLARHFETDAEEAENGVDSWILEARHAGMGSDRCVARLESLWLRGEPSVDQNESGVPLRGRFRADASTPRDRINKPLIDALTRRLMELRVSRPLPYFNLRLNRRWTDKDLPDLAGKLPDLREEVRSRQAIRLGGAAAIWVYAAAIHHALDCAANTEIKIFDPKLPGAFVEIPAYLYPDIPGFLTDALLLEWRERDGAPVLFIRATTTDKFVELEALLALAKLRVPTPERSLSGETVVIDGPGPIWLHLTLSRWVRQLGAKEIAHWDAALKRPVRVWPCSV